jgi:hypothetical protein
MNGSPARNSSRRLRLIRFAISPLHGRPTVGSLTVCPEPFQGASARSISATGASGNSIAAAAARRQEYALPALPAGRVGARAASESPTRAGSPRWRAGTRRAIALCERGRVEGPVTNVWCTSTLVVRCAQGADIRRRRGEMLNLASAFKRCFGDKQKGRPAAASPTSMAIRSGGERGGLARPIAGEAEAGKADDQHRPGRGLGHGREREVAAEVTKGTELARREDRRDA